MGQSVDIPIYVRTLANFFEISEGTIIPMVFSGDLLAYLDAGINHVPGAYVKKFRYDWWNQNERPKDTTSLFSNHTVEACLAFHQLQKKDAQKRARDGTGPILLTDRPDDTTALNQPHHGWHRSVWRDPQGNHCPRCRLY